MNLIKRVFIPVILFSANTFATDYNYERVYEICSPSAHHLTRQQCGYGSVFERHYIKCMADYGYRPDVVIQSGMYEHYLQAYEYCSSIARQNTDGECNYGRRYKIHYDKCMLGYGFDGDGQLLQREKEETYFRFED